MDWESFKIGEETYLAVANNNDGTTHNVDSKIYAWTGTNFSEFQSIPTAMAYNWHSFEIGGEMFLALANERTGPDDCDANIDSQVWLT